MGFVFLSTQIAFARSLSVASMAFVKVKISVGNKVGTGNTICSVEGDLAAKCLHLSLFWNVDIHVSQYSIDIHSILHYCSSNELFPWSILVVVPPCRGHSKKVVIYSPIGRYRHYFSQYVILVVNFTHNIYKCFCRPFMYVTIDD